MLHAEQSNCAMRGGKTVLMRIGDAARRLGVHRDTLKRLERKGLISFSRDWAGDRRVSEEDLCHLEGLLFPKRDTHAQEGAQGA